MVNIGKSPASSQHLTPEDFMEVFKQGRSFWNQWRKDNPKIIPNLSGFDFTDARTFQDSALTYEGDPFVLDNKLIKRMDLKHFNLEHVDFRGSNLSGVIFSDADLERADFRGAELRQADFRDAAIEAVNFSSAMLHDAEFFKARFKTVYFNKADLSDANFKDARFEDAHFEEAEMQGAKFIGAKLIGCEFDKAEMCNVNFTDATLQSVNFFEANIQNSDLTNSIIKETNFQRANLENTNVAGIQYLRKFLDPVPKEIPHYFPRIFGISFSSLNTLIYKYLHWGRRGMTGKYQGAHTSECYGHPQFRRDSMDQDYIDYKRAEWCNPPWNPRRFFLLWPWSWIDYGRSIASVLVLAVMIIAGFGYIYSLEGVLDYIYFTPTQIQDVQDGLYPYYVSAISFSTLGFTDLLQARDAKGQVLLMSNVLSGYFVLGLLLAILSNTVARRS